MSLQPSALGGVDHAPQTYLSIRLRLRLGARFSQHACAAHHPGTVDERGRALTHVRASAAHTTPFPSAASTPALLAPRVTVRVVHCIVQHEQALASGSPRCSHTRPHFALLSALPLAAHQTRRASRSRTCVPAAATASTLALAATVAPMPWSNPFRTGKPPFFPPRCTSTSSAPSAVATSPHPRGPVCGARLRQQRAGTTRVEPAPAPDAPPRAFTTAESSTRNGDVEDDDDEFELGGAGEGDNARSPPTSFEAEYDDEVAETVAHHEEDAREENDSEDEDGGEEDYHDTPAPHPWYKPSVPVLLALAPPIGNWLTGGDHVKDLLLLLLVFYLHQIVEVPWSLYHAARPRRPPAPRDTNPDPAHIPALRARRAARAQSSLRTLELGLLFLCLITPLLGVALLRSLASLSSPSSSSSAAPVPISWFSTALFGLATALRPLRELVSRIVSRTSTLHSQVHAHPVRSSSSRDKNADAESMQAQLAARLELAVAQLAAPDREDALYAYVEDALAPPEKGVRRVERRVGRLRAGTSESHSSSAAGASTGGRDSWFGGPPPPSHTAYVPPLLSPTNGSGSGAGKRGALDSIPEEEGVDVALHVLPHPRHTHPAYIPAHVHAPADVGGTLLPLLRAWLAACVALALYPLYVVLKPVRGVARVVGAGLGVGR
ncbi:hypothetical protein B0H14DRAFT_3871739 [Mycena olivaceomarginata]|nr:hypothetical protein B0H14DRAFT_3871739 [Mycena olivaceomarginata]